MQSLGISYWALGFIDCFSKSGAWLVCPDASLPGGLNLVFGLPMAMVASVFQRGLAVEPLIAYNLAGFLFLTIGVVSCCALMLHFGIHRLWAVCGTLFFYSLPIVHAKGQYAFLMWGFVLFPFTVFSVVLYWHSRRNLAAFAGLLLSLLVALFQEPYSFVMAIVFGCVWVAIHTLYAPATERRFALWKLVGWGLACAIVVGVYKVYVPTAGDFAVMPIDFFRGQGIDLIAFGARTSAYYAFNMPWSFGELNPLSYFTDGESTAQSYLGIGIPLGIVLYLVFARFWKSASFIVIVLVAIAGLLLSLGPSLKLDDHRDVAPSTQITFQDYLMPESSATMQLPHAFIYSLNPVNKMRSVSRWYLMFSLMAVIMVTVGISRAIYSPVGRVVGFSLVLLLVVEYAPNYQAELETGVSVTAQFDKFDFDAVSALSEGIGPGDKVLFLGSAGVDNEYLSLYLCEQVGCQTFNAPGDKALTDSRTQWPGLVKKAGAATTSPEGRARAIEELLRNRTANVVVFPHFDMRWDSYRWPPSDGKLLSGREAVQWLYESGPEYCVLSNALYTFIKPRLATCT